MKRIALGIDLGGTSIKWGLVDEDGKLEAKGREMLPDRNTETAIGMIVDLIGRDREQYGDAFVGVGVGTPGLIDGKRRVVRHSPNFPEWNHVPLLDEINERSGETRIWLENDANLLAFSETTWGAAIGMTDVIALTLGTGVGGAVMTGGRLLTGHGGGAAELGHVPLSVDGPRCGCGNLGCFEAYCNIEGTMRAARKAYGDNDLPASPEELAKAAEEGDERAIAAWAEVGRWLGMAVGGFVNIFNPEAVLIGGGISNAGEYLLGPAREEASKRAYTENWEEVTLRQAGLRDEAGLFGAAAMALKLSGE